MNQVPRKQLASLCSLFTDGDWVESKDQSPTGIRLVQTGNVGIGTFKDRRDKARFISTDTFSRLNCEEIYEGDCLISRLPDPCGRACIIPELAVRMITAVDCTIARFDQTVIGADYFCYYSQSQPYLRSVEQECTGATRKRISRKNLGKIDIPVPSLSEQKRIVSILDEAFGAIDRAKEIAQQNLVNARELANSAIEATLLGQVAAVVSSRESGSELLAAILGERKALWSLAEDEKIGVAPDRARRGKYTQPNPPEELPNIHLPDNWTWATLDQLSYFIVDYRGKTPPQSDGGIPVVSAANIKGGEVRLEPPRYVSQETYDKWSVRGEPKGGDVIVTTEAPVGASAIYPEGNKYLLTRRVFAVRVAQCSPIYIHAVIESGFAQRFFDSHSHGATVPRILKPKLLSLPIPLPPFATQIEIAKQIAKLNSATRTLTRLFEQKLTSLDELKQSILQKAFTGQLTAKSPELEAVP